MLARAFAEKVVINASRRAATSTAIRTLASSSNGSGKSEDPPRFRRRTPKSFHEAPTRKVRSKKAKEPFHLTKEGDIGPDAERALKYLKRNPSLHVSHESMLRAADYMSSEYGSTEDLVGQRRAMMELWDDEDAGEFRQKLDEVIQHAGDHNFDDLDLPWVEDEDKEKGAQKQGIEDGIRSKNNDDGINVDHNQIAYGPWSETIVRVDRVQKVQRGGTMVRYRALVVGGNLNGCAGFGVAKANAPNEATANASRIAKRNIFFIDRYNGTGLTTHLAGRQNSCKVMLRSVNPNRGLHGHPLVLEILKYFGITDCTAKSHGNRNVYNVVRATFKAIMTHESLEDIALKRGKRLLNLERAKRLKI
mmetsp:Transcript_23251/g.34018  ORF Transcript_23251/g.34018 Transcript_23251/m.34018 type:complete len:362 (-) Transcript_23251:42-1127(-)|eukprot:CAMPEP_0197238584 /NCGR_PEP_ID=MMETSP1429-20130617/5080_1 /TAXON_ID=49237 /ORGANISM="Chaetoceros  sp., Strain UNC1202" /LENGTH=361 /DNA_ID=CAMNT_0042697777 /DNA_START=40 /DNA_END=1125 /DNA_ORIENTATION=+